MSPFARILHPLRQAAAAFFKHDIALRREGDGVHIVLEERKAKAVRKPSRAEVTEQREKAELELMRVQLAELLNELPGTRDTLRHLVFVEQALEKKGLRALHKLPLDVLQRALEQLEGLVTNWSPVGLASLRSKMAVAVIDREHMDPEAEADAYKTAAVLDGHDHGHEHGHEGGPPSVSGPITVRGPQDLPEVQESSDDEALAAAYAAIGAMLPPEPTADVEMHGELNSPSARAVLRESTRPLARQNTLNELQLRELQT